MTVIEVHFLTGRYSATSHHDRGQPEWPPHGARLFSAMVAAWADAETPDKAEGAALEWLEALPPPRITAPEMVRRRVVSHFVPVNDFGVMTLPDGRTKKDRHFALPGDRLKKERYFPSVTLVQPQVSGTSDHETPTLPRIGLAPPVIFSWDDSAPSEVAESLDGLLGRVTRLGHSSSLVSCRLRDEEPEATYTPGEGTLMLRWVRPGQLAALEEEYQRHQAIRPRSLPFRGVRYRSVESVATGPVDAQIPATAGDWIVFEIEPSHRYKPMTRTVELARVLRKSVLKHVADPPPEGVSGHLPDGTPTDSPHIAFLVLPNVGHEHGDGRVTGLAVSLPQSLDDVARNATLRGIGKWERERDDRLLKLTMGRGGAVEMRRRQPPFTLVSLQPQVWAWPSRWWASVTPVALPTHPGDLRRGSAAARVKAWARAEEAVARSCEHVGLPRPADMRVSLISHFVGARPASDYPTFRQGHGADGGVVRRLVHASIEFAEPVRGPLMLGSGRFLGLGLMRPIDETDGGGAVTSEGSNGG